MNKHQKRTWQRDSSRTDTIGTKFANNNNNNRRNSGGNRATTILSAVMKTLVSTVHTKNSMEGYWRSIEELLQLRIGMITSKGWWLTIKMLFVIIIRIIVSAGFWTLCVSVFSGIPRTACSLSQWEIEDCFNSVALLTCENAICFGITDAVLLSLLAVFKTFDSHLQKLHRQGYHYHGFKVCCTTMVSSCL